MEDSAFLFTAMILALLNAGIAATGLWITLSSQVRVIKVVLNTISFVLYGLSGHWGLACIFLVPLVLDMIALIFSSNSPHNMAQATMTHVPPQIEEKVDFKHVQKCTNPRCRNFGVDLPNDVRFCYECGNPIEYTGKTTQL